MQREQGRGHGLCIRRIRPSGASCRRPGCSGAAWLLTIVSSHLVASVPLPHWPSTSGVLLTFLNGPWPPHLTGPTTVCRLVAATASRTSFAASALAALERIGRDLEQRVREADRLRPLLLGAALVGRGQRLRALLRQRRRERMRRAPPDLGGQAVAEIAERLDRAREQQRLAERDHLRPDSPAGAPG